MGGGGGRFVVAIGMAAGAMLAGCADTSSIARQPPAPSPQASPLETAQPVELPRAEVASIARPEAAPHQAVRLVGLSPAEIERLLGHPRFVRHDGQAQIWRFANQSCILDVFFYREAAGYTVRHYELRAPGVGDGIARPCPGDVSVLLQAQSG